MSKIGVYSEVGKLRKVLVHRPDLSLKRLTPSNCEELLFDGVLWVKKARWEHDAFVDQMRSRGIEVVLVQDLLTETMKDPEARKWLLDRKVTANEQGLAMPILAPLADFAKLPRSIVVTAYRSASGLLNLITPTSVIIMGALAVARTGYDRWF